MDLNHALSVLNSMVEREIVDFRVVAPLILGLSKIYFRKMNYLLTESNSTLDNLRNPFSEQNLGKALGLR
jgi:tryptophan 2,3-dioxygenase